MRETLKDAQQITCDGCGRSTIIRADEEMITGFHGNVLRISGAGGDGADWFACRTNCIRLAVINSLEKELVS